MRSPSPLGRPVFILEENAYIVHFPHNDALVMTIYIDYCKVLKIPVDGGSSVKILYGHALDRIEDTLELAQKMVIPQTHSLLMDSTEAKPILPEQSSF